MNFYSRNKVSKCVSFRKVSTKNHLKKITQKRVTSNKEFWNFVKPFLANKNSGVTGLKNGQARFRDFFAYILT